MSEDLLVVAGVRVRASGGSARATGLRSDSCSEGGIIVPCSVFSPPLAATLDVTRIGPCAFLCEKVTGAIIPCHVRILCSQCFSHCQSLSSISFEMDSELTRVEARACLGTNLSLVVVPGSTSFIAGGAFPRIALPRWQGQIGMENSEHGIGVASSGRVKYLSAERPGQETPGHIRHFLLATLSRSVTSPVCFTRIVDPFVQHNTPIVRTEVPKSLHPRHFWLCG
jgi:hypothetical protein